MEVGKIQGVIPANLIFFKDDFSIDEIPYRRHIDWLIAAGADGITCNGHAAEVSSLTREERIVALEIALNQVNGRVPVIAGVFTDSTLEAVTQAQDAKELGADAILVFPPSIFMGGFELRPEVVYRHFSMIAEQVDVPIVVFKYPRITGLGYSTDLLLRLASIPNVVAVKDWSQDMVSFEETVRALHALDRPISILSSYSKSLVSTLILGADGILSGNGSVVCDLHRKMFDAVRSGNLKIAREINDRLFPLTQAFYADPTLDQHNRMKEAIVLLGRAERAIVRPPLIPISREERERIAGALTRAGLGPIEAP